MSFVIIDSSIKTKIINQNKILNLYKDLILLFIHINKLEFAYLFKINIINEGNSYTLNKKQIYLNINQTKSKKQLFFICLHELSHILCKDVGHTDNFFKILNFLISKSKEINLL